MKKFWCVLVCFFGIIGIVNAVRVGNLYQTRVPVVSQSSDERNQVLEQALGQVLIKVSGNTQILNNPNVKSHLSSASSLVQEFSYTAAHQPNDPKPYLLQLAFDVEGVNAILRGAGAPIWGQHRPLILIWAESEVPNHPAEVISADSTQSVSSALKQNAYRRGLPIMFPAMDIQDISQVAVNDVVNMDIAKLTNAAKRYGSDAILIGRIIQGENGYNTQWKFIMGTDQWGWNVTGKSLPDVLAALTDHVADALAGRYATVVTDNIQAKVMIKVTGITLEDDFTRLMSYLKHLNTVADVEVVRVANDAVILNVSVRGNQNSFMQNLTSEKKLTPAPADNQMLVYQWNH